MDVKNYLEENDMEEIIYSVERISEWDMIYHFRQGADMTESEALIALQEAVKSGMVCRDDCFYIWTADIVRFLEAQNKKTSQMIADLGVLI